MPTTTDLHNWTASLPAELIQCVQERSHPRRYCDGQALYLPGETGTGLFQLLQGCVRICNYTSDGREFVLSLLHPGDWLGDLSLLDGLPRGNHAIAQGQVSTRWLAKADFDLLCQHHAEIPRALNRMLAHRLRLAFSALEGASVLPLKQRLVRYIEYLALTEPGERADRRLIRVNQEQLGLLLGAARPSVTKALKQLEREGWLQVCYGGVLLHEMPLADGPLRALEV